MKAFSSPHLNGWYDVSDQMRSDIHARAVKAIFTRRQAKARLSSVPEFELDRQRVRENFLQAIGGLPEYRTPLLPRITGKLHRPEYVIEKTIFESQPGFLVSASCYVPYGLSEPTPAVLFLCGHGTEGKGYGSYQAVCHDLARNGIITLAIDPIGQGERFQFLKDEQSIYGLGILEHTHAGFPFFLAGASLARYFLWDAIRALDYLESRPDVDARYLGVTGNSGGGTQACYLMLCDPRLAAAAPCTFVTSLEQILRTGHCQDMEQIISGSMVKGPDHEDFITAMAPRPVMVGAVTSDFFPIEGTIDSVQSAKHIYSLYGQEKNVSLALDNSTHCYSDGLRQASVNWFLRHLKGELRDFVTEPFKPLPAPELHTTLRGQILLDYPESRTITDLTQDFVSAKVVDDMPIPVRRQKLAQILNLEQAGSRCAAIHPRTCDVEDYEGQAEEIWFFSAPNVIVSGILFHPPMTVPSEPRPTTILVTDTGTATPLEDTAVASWLAKGHRVFLFDVRGIGGVQARSISPLDGTEIAPPFTTELRLACDATMAGFSTLGLRVFDILRSYDYLSTRPDIDIIGIHGVGRAAIWALIAAALEPNFAAITCEDMLYSFRELTVDRNYDHNQWDMRVMAWGLLDVGDIQDFIACVEPRSVTLVKLRDACGKELDSNCSEIPRNGH